MHCHEFRVRPGQRVKANDVIALSGGAEPSPKERRGSSTGAHLHFGVCLYEPWSAVIDPVSMYTQFSRVPRFGGPFDTRGSPPNIWRHYANNESAENGIGGYYAIGLRRNFHGGVHLFPENGERDTPVRAMAPGFIVAARLPGRGSLPLRPESLQAVGNWPGFVLVRHDLQELQDQKTSEQGEQGERAQRGEKSAQGEKGKRGAFYSLYMHLKSPLLKSESDSWKDGAAPAAIFDPKDPYLEVPWFRSLTERRYGAFIHTVDERPPAATQGKKGAGSNTQPLGRLLWAAEKVETKSGTPTKAEYRVTDERVKTITISSRSADSGATGTSEAQAPQTDRVDWVYKPSSVELVKAVDELAWGSVVTFTEPFFPVRAGDVLGLVGPLPKELDLPALRLSARLVDATGKVPTNAKGEAIARSLTTGSGFLHWQVFAPEEGENGVALLVELAAQLTKDAAVDGGLPAPQAPKFSVIRDVNKDCYIDIEEMRSELKPALAKGEREAFDAAFSHIERDAKTDFSYASAVVEMLDGATSFAPKQDDVDWAPGCKYKYPLLLQLEEQHLVAPDENSSVDGKYTLTLDFWRRSASEFVPLTCGPLCDRASCSRDLAKDCAPKTFEISAELFKKRRDERTKLLTFKIMVPANADRMTIDFGPGLAGEAMDCPMGSDLTLLKDALAPRWRGATIKHPNEWCIASVEKIARKLKGHIEFTSLAKEFAWCDPEKEVTIERNELESGVAHFAKRKAKEAVELFAGKDAFLPANASIEDIHPTTAVWLLNLVDRHKKAALVESISAKTFRKEDAAPLAVAWVTSASEPKPEVGGQVNVLVVDDDFGDEDRNMVRLIAEGPGGLQLELGRLPYQQGGVAIASVRVCFWGDWRVRTSPASKEKATFGTQTLSISPLAFETLSADEASGPLNAPVKASDGKLSWLIKVKSPVRAVDGFVTMQSRRLDGQWPALGAREDVVVAAVALPVLEVSAEEGKGVPKDAAALEVRDGFIVGLKDPKGKDARVSAGFRLSDYRRAATDLLVACPLLDALLRIRAKVGELKLTIDAITAEGVSMVVRPTVAPSSTPGTSTKLEVACGEVAREVATTTVLVARPMKDKLGRVELKVEGPIAPLTSCGALAPYASVLRTTSAGAFVLEALGSLGNFTPTELRTACEGGSFRLAVSLARALEHLVSKLGAFGIVWLSRDGLTCRISQRSPAAVAFAQGCGLFSSIRLEQDGLTLTVSPDAQRFMVVQFDAGPLVAALGRRADLKPGEQLQYRFFFETLHGLRYLVGDDGTSQWPADERAPLTLQLVESLARGKRKPQRLTYGPSGPAPDLFSKVAIDGLELTWLTRKAVPGIEARFSCLGLPADWAGLSVKVSVATTGAFAVVAGCASLKRPQDRGVLSVHIRVPDDKAYTRTVRVRVEVESKGKPFTQVAPVEKSIDCEPKWLQGRLTLDDSAPDVLVVRCRGQGLELPEVVNGGESPVGASREFVLEVEDVTVGAQPGVGPPKVPRVPTVTYAVRGNGRGFLKAVGPEAGVFEARLAKVAGATTKDPIPMVAGRTYKLTLGRPKSDKAAPGQDRWPVRGTYLAPLSQTYTFQGSASSPATPGGAPGRSAK